MPDNTQINGDNFIGSTASRQGNSTFSVADRISGDQLPGNFVYAERDEIAATAMVAAEAFVDYRSASPGRRAQFLRVIADSIERLGDVLLVRASAETALPIPRLTGERARTTGQLRMFADLVEEGSWVEASIDRAIADRQPLPKPDVRRMSFPLGPIAVFGASNFPFAYSVAGGDTASALAAGCPVVVKAHPAHPGTSELVARAILQAAKEAGMPDGVFSMVHADNPGAIALVQHDAIEGVGFTGSLRGGRALFDAAAARHRPIPVFAEMGSVNPVFLMPRAMENRWESIASGYAQSLLLGFGQFCTNPGLVFGVAGEGWERFKNEVVRLLDEATMGTMLTEGIASAYGELTSILKSTPGVQRLTSRDAAPSVFSTDLQTLDKANYIALEVFGPSCVLVECASDYDMIQAILSVEGQLTGSIHCDDGDQPQKLISGLQQKVGRIVFNGFPTGVEVCPSMVHGGPYPASTDSRFSAVGTSAIARWARPVCFQNCPNELLPVELKEANPRRIWRTIDGELVAPR